MKRYGVLIGAVLVSACAASTVAGCGDDDNADISSPDASADGSGDAHLSFPEASTADHTVTPVDANMPDTFVPDAGVTDSGTDADSADTGAADTGTDTGTDSGNDAGADSGNDAGADSGKDAAAPTCGTAVTGPVVSVFPIGASVVGTTVTYAPCPVPTLTTANGGNVALGQYALNVALVNSHFEVTGVGFRNTFSAEINSVVFPAPPNPGAPIPLQVIGTGISPFDASKAHLLVSIGAAKNGCTQNGNTFAVVGHPEAVVKYVSTAGTDVGAATSTDGLAWISGLTPGPDLASVTVTPSVAGCVVNNTFTTGKVTLVANSATTLNLQLGK